MRAVCVYCGANPGTRPVYAQAAAALGRLIAEQKIRLVYGGGKVGLMGIVADAVLAHGGEAVGIIPDSLLKKEVGHQGLTELHVVENMHQRKQMMADMSDAFIAMPGGIGTCEELFEVFTWQQIGYHAKGIGLLNVDGYYDPLLQFLRHMVGEDFLKDAHLKQLQVATAPAELLACLREFKPTYVDRWAKQRDKI